MRRRGRPLYLAADVGSSITQRVRLAQRTERAALQPLLNAVLMKGVRARQSAELLPSFALSEANGAREVGGGLGLGALEAAQLKRREAGVIFLILERHDLGVSHLHHGLELQERLVD